MQTWFYTSHNLCCWPNLLKSTQETSLITFTYILLTFFRRLKWCPCLFILPYVHCNAFSRPQIFACRMIPSTRNRGTGKICVMQLCDCNLQLCLLCKFPQPHTILPCTHAGCRSWCTSWKCTCHIVLWEVYWINMVAFPVGKCLLIFILFYICRVKVFVNKHVCKYLA